MRIVLAVGLLWLIAAAAGIGPVSNSAPVGTMLVHADLAPPFAPGFDTIAARLFFSTDSQRSWTERAMLRLARPGYDSTWQATVAVPSGPGFLWYYVNAEHGGAFATQSPLNEADAWPIPDNLLARIARDTVGDAASPEGPWLDLTGARVGRSAGRFYVELTNNHTSWPTSGGLLKWFAYSLGFSNPEAPSDSWVFAAVYVSAWPVMETGLFAINRYTGATPTRIGDVDASTSGNRLLMRCNIADITADPRFGPWPGSGGWLRAAASTQTITTGGAATKDTTVPGMFHATRTQRPALGTNRPFTLVSARVAPDTGTPETEFSFTVDYTDPDTNPPTRRRVYCGAGGPDSFDLAPDNRRYWRGVTFRGTKGGFAPGPREATFAFSDGGADTTIVVGFYVNDTVGIVEDGAAGRPAAHLLPTVLRGSLFLPPPAGAMFSAAGRRVMALAPGPNDVSRLAPGVYFVRQADGITRVVVQR
jgi:hypothetical protein